MPTDQCDLRAVIFDLDDTLNDRQQSWIEFVKRMANPLYGDLEFCEPEDIYHTIAEVDQGGYGDKADLFSCMSRLPWKSPKSADEVGFLWRTHFPKCMVVREGVADLLTRLRDSGIRTGIVTNGRDDGQRAKLREMGLSQAVDVIIASGGIGYKKPDPRIYEIVLTNLGVAAVDTLFIGDSPQSDVVGPAKASMRTAWMANGRDWPLPDVWPNYILQEFADLDFVLSKLYLGWT